MIVLFSIKNIFSNWKRIK